MNDVVPLVIVYLLGALTVLGWQAWFDRGSDRKGDGE